MKKYIFFLFLFISYFIYSVDYKDILLINLPDINSFLKSNNNKKNKLYSHEVAKAFIPVFTVTNRLRLLNYDFADYTYSDPNYSNTINFSFSFDFKNLFDKCTDIKQTTDDNNYKIIELYGKIIKKNIIANKYIENILTLKNYYNAVTDFEKQFSIQDKISELEIKVINEYEEIILFETQLYSMLGITFTYDNINIDYSLYSISNIIKNAYEKYCLINK